MLAAAAGHLPKSSSCPGFPYRQKLGQLEKLASRTPKIRPFPGDRTLTHPAPSTPPSTKTPRRQVSRKPGAVTLRLQDDPGRSGISDVGKGPLPLLGCASAGVVRHLQAHVTACIGRNGLPLCRPDTPLNKRAQSPPIHCPVQIPLTLIRNERRKVRHAPPRPTPRRTSTFKLPRFCLYRET